MKQKHIEKKPDHWRNLLGFGSDFQKVNGLHESGRLPQTILFTGREGIGKRIFIAKLVASFYCLEGTACGQCGPCHEVSDLEHTELLWLDAEKTFKLEHAQQVQDHLSVQAGTIKQNGVTRVLPRVVVMVDIERFNAQGANRLLKILEEPPENSLILFSTSRPKQLLDTILSRVIKWHLEPPKMDESMAALSERFPDLATANLEKALVESGLAMGKALQRLEKSSQEDDEVLDKLVKNLLFSKGRQLAMDASKELIRGRQISANDLANRIELLLNEYYKWRLSAKELRDKSFFDQVNITIDAQVLRRWRESLTTIRKLARRQAIPLNAQMLAETFALTR